MTLKSWGLYVNVVKSALKAKNNGLEKEGRGGVLLEFTQMQVGTHPHPNFEVDSQRSSSILSMPKALYKR
jgi:hypothetical protein